MSVETMNAFNGISQSTLSPRCLADGIPLARSRNRDNLDYCWRWRERILTDLRAVGIRGKLQVLEGPAFRAKVGQGRKGYPGNRTIVQNIGPRAGGAKTNIGIYAVCGGSASFVCEPQIEKLWAKHQATVDLSERDSLIKAIQRILIEEYYFVPIYLNPFVQAVGPRVLPEGDGFHRYWDTLHAPYPWPWEVWEVKE